MSMYKAEYDTRLLYSQSYSADEGLFVSTDCYAFMWTYPGARTPTTTRVRLTYIYTKENGGIAPVQGIMEQWKSEGWTVMDEFCDGFTDFNEPEELRDQMMQMVRSFLLGVPIGAEVEGDESPKPPSPNKTGLKKPTAIKSRIEKLIKKIGIFRVKAKSIYLMSKQVLEKHNGNVPKTFEELEKLPGVGHKTASVVMSQGFGYPAFAVDTHIHRLAQRWGLTNGKNVVQTEKDLKNIFPKKNWNKLHLQIIFYGVLYKHNQYKTYWF